MYHILFKKINSNQRAILLNQKRNFQNLGCDNGVKIKLRPVLAQFGATLSFQVLRIMLKLPLSILKSCEPPKVSGLYVSQPYNSMSIHAGPWSTKEKQTILPLIDAFKAYNIVNDANLSPSSLKFCEPPKINIVHSHFSQARAITN